MKDLASLYLVLLISCENHIFSSRQWLPCRKTFQCFASHDDDFSLRLLPEKLLVIRDSYSDSLAPFLSTRFSEVHLFDPRYNRTSIADYVEENGIDQVLVLYSAANFATDANLFLLAR